MTLDLTKQKPTAIITFLLDRSGSMASVLDATIESFNGYLRELKTEKDAAIDFTLIQFDYPPLEAKASIEKVCLAVPIAQAPFLSKDNYVPRGGTPLIEAAIVTIEALAKSLTERKDQPKVVLCIQTDGQENQSGSQYTWERLKTLVSAKQEAGWEINFMGAGIDAYKQATMMGVTRQHTMSYDHVNVAASAQAFAASASNSAGFAAGRRANTAYTVQQKTRAGDKFDPDAKAAKPSADLDLTTPRK